MLKKFAIGLGVVAAMLSSVSYAEMLSVKGSSVNVRETPSTKADVRWELTRGYPMSVIKKQGDWVQVKDFEGTLGWVSRPLLHKQPHHIVTVNVANLRKSPATNAPVVSKLAKYDLVATLAKKNGWVQAKTSSGKVGWLSNSVVWGW